MPTSDSRLIAVVSYDMANYNRFVRLAMFNEDFEFRQISSVEDIRGRKFCSYILLHDWQKIRHCEELIFHLKNRIC